MLHVNRVNIVSLATHYPGNRSRIVGLVRDSSERTTQAVEPTVRNLRPGAEQRPGSREVSGPAFVVALAPGNEDVPILPVRSNAYVHQGQGQLRFGPELDIAFNGILCRVAPDPAVVDFVPRQPGELDRAKASVKTQQQQCPGPGRGVLEQLGDFIPIVNQPAKALAFGSPGDSSLESAGHGEFRAVSRDPINQTHSVSPLEHRTDVNCVHPAAIDAKGSSQLLRKNREVARGERGHRCIEPHGSSKQRRRLLDIADGLLLDFPRIGSSLLCGKKMIGHVADPDGLRTYGGLIQGSQHLELVLVNDVGLQARGRTLETTHPPRPASYALVPASPGWGELVLGGWGQRYAPRYASVGLYRKLILIRQQIRGRLSGMSSDLQIRYSWVRIPLWPIPETIGNCEEIGGSNFEQSPRNPPKHCNSKPSIPDQKQHVALCRWLRAIPEQPKEWLEATPELELIRSRLTNQHGKRWIQSVPIYTYFVQEHAQGYIKIGLSGARVANRVSSLQIGCPSKLGLVALILGDHEFPIHKALKSDRIRGEWFNPTPAVLRWVDIANEFRRAYPRQYKAILPGHIARATAIYDSYQRYMRKQEGAA